MLTRGIEKTREKESKKQTTHENEAKKEKKKQNTK